MKAKPFTGLTAEIKINNAVLAYVSGVDLNIEKSIIEILQFGATYKEKVPAIKDWSASIDGTVALAAGNSQQKLFDAFENDEELTIGIFLNDFTYFEGKAFVENFKISGAPDAAMTLASDLAGNGAVILTLPTSYSVKITSGIGGTCNPGGTRNVAAGDNLIINIKPADGYAIELVLDNDDDVTSSVIDNVYRLNDISEDHTINITFAEGPITPSEYCNFTLVLAGADSTKIGGALYDGITHEYVAPRGTTDNPMSMNYALTPGSYRYEFYSTFYEPVIGTLEISDSDINTDKTVTVEVIEATYATVHINLTNMSVSSTVTFTVVDSESQPVQAVESTPNVYAVYHLTEGTYTYIVSADGYTTVTNTITIQSSDIQTEKYITVTLVEVTQ